MLEVAPIFTFIALLDRIVAWATRTKSLHGRPTFTLQNGLERRH
jgi:hypothetical protein